MHPFKRLMTLPRQAGARKSEDFSMTVRSEQTSPANGCLSAPAMLTKGHGERQPLTESLPRTLGIQLRLCGLWSSWHYPVDNRSDSDDQIGRKGKEKCFNKGSPENNGRGGIARENRQI